jgi:hypothetical protein
MDTPSQPFVVTDIRIPFFRLVLFLVKLTLASIPAAIILVAISFLISALLAAVLGIPMDFMTRRGMV